MGYDARLKSPVLFPAPYAGGFALLVTFVEEGVVGRLGPAWWEVAAAALIGTGRTSPALSPTWTVTRPTTCATYPTA